MATQDFPSLESLINIAQKAFEEKFDGSCEVGAVAPGRVNLIGEHTDYNDGFVLPMALPMGTVIVGKIRDGVKTSRMFTLADVGPDEERVVEFDAAEPKKIDSPKWANYVLGVMANFHGSPLTNVAFDAVIVSSVPIGGGLSSSASLEVATYTFLEILTDNKASSLVGKALACQKAEHDFAGMPCGIMDQFIAVMGETGAAVKIDCRSMEIEKVALTDPDALILIANSNVKHSLTGSEYPTRRKQCESAAKIVGKKSLRDSDLEEIEARRPDFVDEVVYRRAKHVVTEIKRTELAADALNNGDYTEFGRLMNQSHDSLRDDFEVSCPEVDLLVSAARTVPGVFGSRMTGGGFGGCTVTLVTRHSVDSAIEAMERAAAKKPIFYLCSAADGARILPNV